MNAHDMTNESALPYRRLCMAIIVQAIRDAIGIPADTRRTNETVSNQRRALVWIKVPNPDFSEVCEGAGFDPDTIRKQALAFIKSEQPMPRLSRGGEIRECKRQPLSHASIAAHAGCSTSTVRNVLQCEGGSPNLQARVHAAVRDIEKELAA